MAEIQVKGDAAKYEGKRLRQKGPDGVFRCMGYAMLDGFRRQIPDADTYTKLFGDGEKIDVSDIDSIPHGETLSTDAVLARPDNGADRVYLVSNGQKRQVRSPEAMEKYAFHKGTVVTVPHVLLECIPTGIPIG